MPIKQTPQTLGKTRTRGNAFNDYGNAAFGQNDARSTVSFKLLLDGKNTSEAQCFLPRELEDAAKRSASNHVVLRSVAE
jgi:hypothetical protein